MNNNWIDTIGIDPSPIMDQVLSKGVNKYDAAKLVNNLIAVNLGQAPRHFAFSAPLPAADADCAPKFAPQFSHQDWIDGESVVQASESADDRGFNWRFNAIRADLDALNADTKQLAACLDTLRASLVGALEDVAAELARIDADLAGLGTRVAPSTPWQHGIAEAPQFLGVRVLDGSKVTMWQHESNVFMLPAVDTVGLTTTLNQHITSGSVLVDFAQGNPAFATDLAAGTSIAALTAKYGANPVGDGRTVGQVLSIVPPQSTFADTPSLIDSVVSLEQGYVRSTVGSIDAVGALTGVTSTGAPLSATSAGFLAGSVTGAPTELRSALTAAGVGSVADLSALQPAELQTTLAKSGVNLTDLQTSQLQIAARTITGIGFHVG